MEFIKQTEDRRIGIIDETAARMGILSQAVEKDWWVTQTLRALFISPSAKYLVFKGGTSLSKCYGLIQRFSEDIDIALERNVLGITEPDDELSNRAITRMRIAAKEFTSTKLKDEIEASLRQLDIPEEEFTIEVVKSEDERTDPQVLLVNYKSLTPPNEYFKPIVKIEVMIRSMIEPNEVKSICSFIGETFPDTSFADAQFNLTVAMPKKTFLEKAFLLHELFISGSSRDGKFKSRHLSDLEKMMDTEYGLEAVEDHNLFDEIVKFRSKFTKEKGVDYSTHTYDNIDFVPPKEVRDSWEKDYADLTENMFRKDRMTLGFPELITRLEILRERFREKGKRLMQSSMES